MIADRLGHDAAEFFGYAERRDPQLARLRQDLRRCRACAIGGERCGADLLGRERADRLAQHLLLLVGGQVEELRHLRGAWRAGRASLAAALKLRLAAPAVRNPRRVP